MDDEKEYFPKLIKSDIKRHVRKTAKAYPCVKEVLLYPDADPIIKYILIYVIPNHRKIEQDSMISGDTFPAPHSYEEKMALIEKVREVAYANSIISLDEGFFSFEATYDRKIVLDECFGDKPYVVLIAESMQDKEVTDRIMPEDDHWVVYEKPLADDNAEHEAEQKEALNVETPQADDKVEQAPDNEWGDNYFVLSGDYWRVSFNKSEEVIITGLKGMKYIPYLLNNPGQFFPVLNLTAGLEGDEARREHVERTATEYDNMTDEQLNNIGMGRTGAPVTDNRNDKNMKKEAQRLLAELEEAKKTGSPMEIDEAQKEYDEFMSYLLSDKTNVDLQFERDRKRIYGSITTAINKIGKNHSELAEHLRTAIVTGGTCSYAHQDDPIDWYVKY